MQIAALAAALAGALLLTWTERIWPEVQEAVIGVMFVLGATGSVLLLASNVHGSEHLRDLLVGQILWAQPIAARVGGGASTPRSSRCGSACARGWATSASMCCSRVAVTVSVQLVGLYLVFATLIVPPLATRRMTRRRLPAAWSLGLAGYAIGLVLSTALDLPSGPVIVWVLVALALAWQALTKIRTRWHGIHATLTRVTGSRQIIGMHACAQSVQRLAHAASNCTPTTARSFGLTCRAAVSVLRPERRRLAAAQ